MNKQKATQSHSRADHNFRIINNFTLQQKPETWEIQKFLPGPKLHFGLLQWLQRNFSLRSASVRAPKLQWEQWLWTFSLLQWEIDRLRQSTESKATVGKATAERGSRDGITEESSSGQAVWVRKATAVKRCETVSVEWVLSRGIDGLTEQPRKAILKWEETWIRLGLTVKTT